MRDHDANSATATATATGVTCDTGRTVASIGADVSVSKVCGHPDDGDPSTTTSAATVVCTVAGSRSTAITRSDSLHRIGLCDFSQYGLRCYSWIVRSRRRKSRSAGSARSRSRSSSCTTGSA